MKTVYIELMSNLKDHSLIYLEQSKRSSEFFKYISLMLKEGWFSWVAYSFFLKIFSKKSTLILLKKNTEVIGGFFVTTSSLVKWKSYNWFDSLAKIKIQELVYKNYFYCDCLLVKKSFRKGLRLSMLASYLNQNPAKVFFTATVRATRLAIKNGAEVYYSAKHSIYTFEPINM